MSSPGPSARMSCSRQFSSSEICSLAILPRSGLARPPLSLIKTFDHTRELRQQLNVHQPLSRLCPELSSLTGSEWKRGSHCRCVKAGVENQVG
jgi:hypothetical protein